MPHSSEQPLHIWGSPPQSSAHGAASAPQGPRGPEHPTPDPSGPYPVPGHLPEYAGPAQEGPARTPSPDDDARAVDFAVNGEAIFGKPRMENVPPPANTEEAGTPEAASEPKADSTKEPLFRFGKFRKAAAGIGVVATLGAGGFGFFMKGEAANEHAAYDRAYQVEHSAPPDSKEYNRAQTIADGHAQAGAADEEMAGYSITAGGIGALFACGALATAIPGGIKRGVGRVVSSEQRARRLHEKAAKLEAKKSE